MRSSEEEKPSHKHKNDPKSGSEKEINPYASQMTENNHKNGDSGKILKN